MTKVKIERLNTQKFYCANKGLWDIRMVQRCTGRGNADNENAVELEMDHFDIDLTDNDDVIDLV